jgi:hypothetical protein
MTRVLFVRGPERLCGPGARALQRWRWIEVGRGGPEGRLPERGRWRAEWWRAEWWNTERWNTERWRRRTWRSEIGRCQRRGRTERRQRWQRRGVAGLAPFRSCDRQRGSARGAELAARFVGGAAPRAHDHVGEFRPASIASLRWKGKRHRASGESVFARRTASIPRLRAPELVTSRPAFGPTPVQPASRFACRRTPRARATRL